MTPGTEDVNGTRLRVLHVMWSLGIGGAERALYQLALAQRVGGADVGVLVASEPGLYGELLAEQGITVETLHQKGGAHLLAAWRARRLFERWPIVHFHVAEPPLMAAASASGARMYYTHRAGSFAYPLRRRLRYRSAGYLMRRRFSGIVGNTAHAAAVAAELFDVPRDDIGNVYNGIEWELLAPQRDRGEVTAELGLRDGDVILGTSGNLRDWKRVDLIVRALARVDETVVLLVVGDGPERRPLQNLAERLGVSRRTRFVGSTENVADYLQVMDLFALPSGAEESFGNSAVEAMGFGLPTIVMRDGGGLTEHVVHEQTGIVAESAEDLESWIGRLAGDQELRRAMGARARDATRARYTTGEMVGDYERLYRGGAADRPRPSRAGR